MWWSRAQKLVVLGREPQLVCRYFIFIFLNCNFCLFVCLFCILCLYLAGNPGNEGWFEGLQSEPAASVLSSTISYNKNLAFFFFNANVYDCHRTEGVSGAGGDEYFQLKNNVHLTWLFPLWTILLSLLDPTFNIETPTLPLRKEKKREKKCSLHLFQFLTIDKWHVAASWNVGFMKLV